MFGCLAQVETDVWKMLGINKDEISGFHRLYPGGPTIFWGKELDYLLNFTGHNDGDIGVVTRPTKDGWTYRCVWKNGKWVSLHPNESTLLSGAVCRYE